MSPLENRHIVASVARTLEKDVLPFAPGGWPASYLRSAIMLLVYLEDRLSLTPDLLEEDESDLREVLETGAKVYGNREGDENFATHLRDISRAVDSSPRAHEARRSALCDLITKCYDHTVSCDGLMHANLTDAIAKYRRRSMAREDKLWQRAEKLRLM